MFNNYYTKVTVVDNNFLTSEECQHNLMIVQSLKNNWQSSFKYPYLSFLPFPLYSISDHKDYISNTKLYKDLMYQNFKLTYEKLQFKLSNLLNVELFFHDDLNYPGFHISNGKSMDKPNFHRDGFPQFKSIFSNKERFYFGNNILSVVIPLSISSEDDGLLYRTKNLPESDRQRLIYDEFLPYKSGMLIIWDGNIQHSMKPFLVHTSNSRITLQCHIVMGKKSYIFW